MYSLIQIQQKTDSEYTHSVIKYVKLIEKLKFERTRKLKQPLIFDQRFDFVSDMI